MTLKNSVWLGSCNPFRLFICENLFPLPELAFCCWDHESRILVFYIHVVLFILVLEKCYWLTATLVERKGDFNIWVSSVPIAMINILSGHCVSSYDTKEVLLFWSRHFTISVLLICSWFRMLACYCSCVLHLIIVLLAVKRTEQLSFERMWFLFIWSTFWSCFYS